MKRDTRVKFKSIGQTAGFFALGLAVALAVNSRAEIMQLVSGSSASSGGPGCDELRRAQEDALNNKVRLVAFTSPDPSKYFSASSPDSCLGNLSIANLDLSKLIPDPLGLVSGGVDGLIDGLKKAALAAGCAAVRGSVADTISKYNYAIGQVNGAVNVQGNMNQLIDTSIGEASRQVLNGYAMNWTTPTQVNATAGVSLPGVTLPSIASTAVQSQPQLQSQQPAPAPVSLGAALSR